MLELYEQKKTELKSEFAEAVAVALTTDGWTSRATESYLTITCNYTCRSYSLSRNKKINEEAKKMKCFKRLIFKQFKVSGLCGPQFLSYLPKRFMHLYRALYGDAILVYRFGPPIWPPEINKNIWSSLFL